MSTDWNLYGSGRRHRDEWAQLHQATRGWAAAWADNRGFHLDAMPAEPPAATHLWAWAPGRWLRARIDTPHWWAALLTPDSTGISKSVFSIDETVPRPRVNHVLPWSHRDRRVQHYRCGGSSDVLGQDTVQLVPLRPTTGVFIGALDSLPTHLRELLEK
ncbi:hypothetical protein [Saccharopolyspora rectivirgula]|uniref:hypothetical protein n=1 Tax=Saccharopolyspora rectivirgula TaxID=28042 RepID=UPI00240A24AE|nr:hypothetical protein [Saccharopolyspora rectivirgula]